MTGLSQISKPYKANSLIDKMILQKNVLLDHFIDLFSSTSFLKLKFGIESEFYIRAPSKSDTAFDIKKVSELCSNVTLFDKVVPEKGFCQYEYTTKPTYDIADLINSRSIIENQILNNVATDTSVDFSPRPFDNDCANAMQISFSVFNNHENYIFSNRRFVTDLASFLVARMDDLMIFSNSSDNDFARYNIQYNRQIHKNGKFVAPTVKSWGFDNRSCAIRVARSSNEESRIEIRLPSNNCQIELFFCVLLYLISEFLKSTQPIEVSDPIYGNAFDKNYKLPMIIGSQEDALKKLFDNDDLLQLFVDKVT